MAEPRSYTPSIFALEPPAMLDSFPRLYERCYEDPR